jgi:uncharacterized membrane protein HdeD (DUF308 family)
MGRIHADPWDPTTGHATRREEERALRRVTLLEGGVMLLLGTLALIFPLVASVWLTALVALAFLVAGVVSGLATLLRARQLTRVHTVGRMVVAVLLVVSGSWMVNRLAGGASAAAIPVAALALATGVVFVLEGAMASVVSLSHRHVPAWGWGLVNGLVTLGIGVLLLAMKTINLPWVLGTLIGISFLFSGIDVLTFGASFHLNGEKGSQELS